MKLLAFNLALIAFTLIQLQLKQRVITFEALIRKLHQNEK